MLETQRRDAERFANDPSRTYNEVVIEQAAFVRDLPGSIVAVVYVADAEACVSTNHWVRSRARCGRGYARRVHESILRDFGLRPAELPLMRLDLSDWRWPFTCDTCS